MINQYQFPFNTTQPDKPKSGLTAIIISILMIGAGAGYYFITQTKNNKNAND